METTDTIVAVASAPGGACRGVVRISGPHAVDVARKLTGGRIAERIISPIMVSSLVDLPQSRTLPVDLLVWPGRRSYTREPTVEVHTLGSPPLIELLVRRACECGARLANPGEFTLRAFLAGRIDLTQAEAVLGVIDATNEQSLQTALKQLAGGMASPLQSLREELLMLLAELEAGLDFADEDIEFISPEVLAERLLAASASISKLRDQLQHRAAGGGLPRVVLAGPTNAGKSSLFNALVSKFGEQGKSVSAIVSAEPGATRDYLVAPVTLAGVHCELVDTAGTEALPTGVSPAQLAQQMTGAARREATVVLLCSDASGSEPALSSDSPGELRVLTKADQQLPTPESREWADPHPAIATSAHEGTGLDALAEAVAERLCTAAGSELVPSTAARSGASLAAALAAVAEAQSLAAAGVSEELVAAELRIALDELGQVAGAVYTDDVLDRVFSKFCIGK